MLGRTERLPAAGRHTEKVRRSFMAVVSLKDAAKNLRFAGDERDSCLSGSLLGFFLTENLSIL